jgi:hypothetical protein
MMAAPRQLKPRWSRLHTCHQLSQHPVALREIVRFSEEAKADFAAFLAVIDGQDGFSMLVDLNEALRLAYVPIESMNGQQQQHHIGVGS